MLENRNPVPENGILPEKTNGADEAATALDAEVSSLAKTMAMPSPNPLSGAASEQVAKRLERLYSVEIPADIAAMKEEIGRISSETADA